MSVRLPIARATLVGAALCATVVTAGCSDSGNGKASGSTPTSTPSGSSGAPTAASGPNGHGHSNSTSANGASNSPRGHARSGGTPKLSVVPAVKTRTLPPVPIHSTAAFGGGVSARVTRVAEQKQTDQGPGVIAGAPAVAFTLRFANNSEKSISVNTVNVTATYGHSSPAVPANMSSNQPLRNDIKPGATATGVYAFVIPRADREKVALAVWYAQGKPTVVFSGSVS